MSGRITHIFAAIASKNQQLGKEGVDCHVDAVFGFPPKQGRGDCLYIL